MVFWIIVGLCVSVGLYFGVVQYRFTKKLNIAGKSPWWSAVSYGLVSTGVLAVFGALAFVVLMIFGTMSGHDTVVQSTSYTLSPVSSRGGALVVSSGTSVNDYTVFKTAEGVQKIGNYNTSIITDSPSDRYAEKIVNRSLVPWLAPFPLSGNTHYDIHVPEPSISGPYMAVFR